MILYSPGKYSIRSFCTANNLSMMEILLSEQNKDQNSSSNSFEYSFSDLVDIGDMQRLLESFSKLTGLPIGILDQDSNVLASAGWQNICVNFHRINPESLKYCAESDSTIKKNLATQCPISYKCKHGLWDVAYPIIVEKKHIATVFFGQFFINEKEKDVVFFERQAEKFGFNKTEYLKSVNEVPVFSLDKVEHMKNFNATLTQIITQKGYANLLLKKEKIEELRKVNEQLKESELKFRRLFEQAGVGVAEVETSTGRFVKVNKKFADILGYSIAEMMHLTFLDFTYPEDIDESATNRQELIKKQKKAYAIEKRYVRKDGNVIWVKMSVTTILDIEESKHHISIVQDITENKENEIKLRELNATKDKFFSIISHDLKNPFTILKTSSSLLSRHLENNDIPKSKAKAKMILNATKNGYDLLENLLTWANSQTTGIRFEPQPLNFKDIFYVCTKEVEVLAREKNITITSTIPNDLIFEADEHLLSVVLRNLLTNAIKFTHRGGSITVNTKTEDNNIEVAIIDTGIGIPKEHQDKLFRLDVNFSRPGTESESSTSLGLILCKEFIERHKGKIWVESEENMGSEFKFTIPKKQIKESLI